MTKDEDALAKLPGGLLLEAPADGPGALDCVGVWLRERLRAGQPSELSRLLAAEDTNALLAAHLAEHELANWGTLIAAARDDVVHTIAVTAPIRWLAAHLALALVTADLVHSDFGLVEDLLTLSRDTNAAFTAAFVGGIGNSNGDLLLLVLQARMAMLLQAGPYARLRQLFEARADAPIGTRDLWPGPYDVMIGDGWAHHAAAILRPQDYLEMMSAFPPSFQHAAAEHLGDLASDQIERLFATSPPVFSKEGTPLGPVLLFGLIGALESALEAGDAVAAETIQDRYLAAVLARGDGAWIARSWLQQLFWRRPSRRASRAHSDTAAQQRYTTGTTARLAGRIEPLGGALQAWAMAEEPLWRVDRVLAEAVIVELHAGAEAAAGHLAQAIKDGLVTDTGRMTALANTGAEADLIGRVLSAVPSPQAWFESLWLATYPARERLRFHPYRDETNPAYPSLIWALRGLNACGERPDLLAPFWTRLAEAVFETQLTDPRGTTLLGPLAPICQALVQIGAAMADRDLLDADALAHFMKDQLAPTPDHAALWLAARSAMRGESALGIGRRVGAESLAAAIAAGVAQDDRRGTNAQLGKDHRADLLAFTARL